jgi:drug/metabolite transporter (DMT)-like permease
VIILLLRRLSPRARLVAGAVCVVAGLVLVAVSAVVGGLLVRAIALTVIGVVLGASGVVSGRRARRAAVEPESVHGR